jgi:hypothetical protein
MAALKPRIFVWRTFTSVLLATCFLGALLSGSVLFLAPPGRIANWTQWSIGGVTKHDWAALHVSFSAVFLVGVILHVVFNWRPLVGYFKNRLTRRIGWRSEWVSALMLTAVVAWAALADWPPLGWLLAASENLKQSWDEPGRRAPIPHAELLALRELAAQAQVELSTATDRLTQAGLRGVSPEAKVEDLARTNQLSAQRIYDLILGQAIEPGRGAGHRGEGELRGGGGAGGGGAGHGGGVGWKTLEQMCVEEKLVPEEVLARLKAQGVQAQLDQTLREIATGNGYDRPLELVELIRGTRSK